MAAHSFEDPAFVHAAVAMSNTVCAIFEVNLEDHAGDSAAPDFSHYALMLTSSIHESCIQPPQEPGPSPQLMSRTGQLVLLAEASPPLLLF